MKTQISRREELEKRLLRANYLGALVACVVGIMFWSIVFLWIILRP